MGQPKRRDGRSNTERRKAVLALKVQWDAKRYRLSVEQLRLARERLEQRLASADDLHRAEDRIREEYHDACARTVESRKKA